MRRRSHIGPRRVLDQQLRGCGADRSQHERLDRELTPRVDPGVGGKRRDGRSDQDAHAPTAVQARHHRAAEQLLHQDTLRIHRHVREPRDRAKTSRQHKAPRATSAAPAGRGTRTTNNHGRDERTEARSGKRDGRRRASRADHRSPHEPPDPEMANADTDVRCDPRNTSREAARDASVHRKHRRRPASHAERRERAQPDPVSTSRPRSPSETIQRRSIPPRADRSAALARRLGPRPTAPGRAVPAASS